MPESSTASVQERRRFSRHDAAPRLAINLIRSRQSIAADNVNLSEGGLCLRLQEELEVRSLVQLQLTSAGSVAHEDRRAGERSAVTRRGRSVTCTGRVAWVIQRLDLREAPPFLFDIGIEFVDPPSVLRQFMARQGIALAAPTSKANPAPLAKALDPLLVRGRSFVPHLERSVRPDLRWHLVVAVDGVPCFSERFATERAALDAWAKFKRQQAKR